MKRTEEGIQIEIHDAQEVVPFDLELVRDRSQLALPLCLSEAVTGSPLTEIDSLEANIVSDDDITKVHKEFMDDPSPTDVITFDYGEIISSAETALRQSDEMKVSVEKELILYIIHGMLHLAGYRDGTIEEFNQITELQEKILVEVW
ncbi:MAG: rRNA maturation RNase YbeY [Verrucomicrobiota bacterium]|nr:rRNA maturation RNase YbeY [Verrucomicrobiota bacterium]